MIKIKSNKELFDKIMLLSNRIQCQASYVQNDMELTQGDIKEFIRMSDSQVKDLTDIKTEMLLYVRECNE